MMFKHKILLASALAVIAATPAFAQEGSEKHGGPDGPGGRFEKVDTNSDGFVTKDEMLAAHRARIDTMFEKADTDKDGKLSKEELKKGHEEMRGKMKERMKERMQERREENKKGE